ncbi:MAG: hypothetical protein UU47_C0009G0017 [candidate division TM6 bacterium GW2011_GWE2_41_16]|nr:MAG: hypothetical protein UU47_C0009G0017 [candidate division TM6 bacterium GW2011_GWE2_41_16]
MRRLIGYSLLIFCCIEVVLLGYWFFSGKRGLESFKRYREEERCLNLKAKKITENIADIEECIEDWELYPYYKEAWAREHLNAVYPDEDEYVSPVGNEEDWNE